MTRRFLVLATLVAPCLALELRAQAQVQQQSARRLELTTSSAEARTAFWAAIDASSNIFPLRAREFARKAASSDSTFALARAFIAATATDLTTAQRNAELDRAVSDAAHASTAELLFAAWVRANVLGKTDEARALADATAALLPNDPNIAFYRAQLAPASQVPEAMRDVTRKFPEYAPAYNILAYQLWAKGDRNGAMEFVRQYVRLAPNQPNAHDSFAELLQFSGRFPEALQHYDAAARIDSAYDQAYAGIGEVHMLMGHGDQARIAYLKAVEKAPTTADRINAMSDRATTYIIDGKSKDAVRELANVAASAEQAGLKPQAAAIHRAVAVIEATFGDRKTVAGHLSKAAEIGGSEEPAQHRMSALAYALSGDVATARSAAARFQRAAGTGTVEQQNDLHELFVVIAVAEKDLTRAQSELSQAGAAPLGRAVVAEALKKAGRKSEADSLRTEILGAGTVTLFDVIARAKVSKL